MIGVKPARYGVRSVAIEAVTASVVPACRPRVGMTSSVLNVFQRYTSFPSPCDEGDPERVRRQLISTVEGSSPGEASHHAPGFGLAHALT